MLQLSKSKKKVFFDKRVLKDISKFPNIVVQEILSMTKILEDVGRLTEPYAKKIKKNLTRHY